MVRTPQYRATPVLNSSELLPTGLIPPLSNEEPTWLPIVKETLKKLEDPELEQRFTYEIMLERFNRRVMLLVCGLCVSCVEAVMLI